MKTKLALFGGIAAIITVGSILAAQAQSAALTVSCAGAVTGNQVTWSATTAGGNAPIALLWSGDSTVGGQTSTSFVSTYTTNGTYTAGIEATDASSSVATSTCAAIVSSNVPPATTSTLNVVVSVNNTQGGAATPSAFTVSVSGANASPSSFAGSSTGTAVVVSGGATYSVSASSVANYSMSTSGNCAGPITAGTADACTVTETFVPPSNGTTTLPRVNPASLQIGPNGAFISRGMTVTSVSANSFQAQVWGITYTINWSGNVFPQFLLRGGDNTTSTTNPSQQLHVGDEVGVAGRVSASNPLVVTAEIVRDYSIKMPRKDFHFDRGLGNGFGLFKGPDDHGNGDNASNTGNGTSTPPAPDWGSRINDLFNQLRNLQNLFNGGHGGDNGGHGNGNGH
ncbi:MAG TPA: hypothetical protein VMU07_01700 [Candidatus Paceibacterota bacterium]|nr:hypothetical protein [Candidatus Paceibacterota bacterium]